MFAKCAASRLDGGAMEGAAVDGARSHVRHPHLTRMASASVGIGKVTVADAEVVEVVDLVVVVVVDLVVIVVEKNRMG